MSEAKQSAEKLAEAYNFNHCRSRSSVYEDEAVRKAFVAGYNAHAAQDAVLEKIREGNALMAEGEGDDPETYKEMALHWMSVADEVLRPADKKDLKVPLGDAMEVELKVGAYGQFTADKPGIAATEIDQNYYCPYCQCSTCSDQHEKR